MLVTKSAIRPGSNFNRQGGSIFHQRQHGIENQRLGNIHFDRVDWQQLVTHVRETPLPRALYTQPLRELLARLENTDLLRSIVAKANNPYWLVKELAGHAGLLEQWESA